MQENKSSISEAKSYKEIGEYWDLHDADEIWEKTEEVEFAVDLQSDVFYYAVETSLSSKLHTIAERRGVSAETLLNLWLQEKMNQEVTKN
ncbi:MAG: BrnA antitoxin family protein [Pyrinomonadaceae bacterium]|nr:BrnA antitoxin family protein [Pyrinomonadaceae bacterium]